jgi:hypothetical protein
MATTVSKDSGQFPRKYSWTGLTANDNGDAVKPTGPLLRTFMAMTAQRLLVHCLN